MISSMLPSERARWDLPLLPQPVMAMQSTVPDPTSRDQAWRRTRGTGKDFDTDSSLDNDRFAAHGRAFPLVIAVSDRSV